MSPFSALIAPITALCCACTLNLFNVLTGCCADVFHSASVMCGPLCAVFIQSGERFGQRRIGRQRRDEVIGHSSKPIVSVKLGVKGRRLRGGLRRCGHDAGH